MAMSPLVSVVIPAFNAQEHLATAIDSVLRQTHRYLELIVVDDGSEDHTRDVAEAVKDERVRVISQRNRGLGSARNRGLANTTGTLVAFLDADDWWLPTKLEVQLEAFAQEPQLVVVGCFMQYVSVQRGPLGITGQTVDEGEQTLVAQARLTPFPVGSSALVRREALEAIGGFDEGLRSIPGLVEDLDAISRLAQVGRIGCVPHVLAMYRIHGASASARHFSSQRHGVRFIIERRRLELEGESLTWDAFASRYTPTMSERRTDLVASWYRGAGLSVAENRLAKALFLGVGASVLGPTYTFCRLLRHRPWRYLGQRHRTEGPL